MWLMLVVAHIGGYNIPVMTVQDLYSKSQCLLVLDTVKLKTNDSRMEYSCVYIGDED